MFFKKKKICGICGNTTTQQNAIIYEGLDDNGTPKKYEILICEMCVSLIETQGNVKDGKQLR
jgi:hypothetical protein